MRIIVTGCGRSGTHWLAGVMQQVLGPERAAHEPPDYAAVSDVVVDSRLRWQVNELAKQNQVVHLVRDGRDVVRSLHSWYRGRGNRTPEWAMNEWRVACELMREFPTLRLEDLIAPVDPSRGHTLPHWTEWDEALTEQFWRECGEQMARCGYRREGP